MMKSEGILIKTSNGNLEGDFYVGENDRCIIMCHGFCSNKDREKTVMAAEAFNKLGFNVLRFNFGGSGQSYDCEINVENQIEDLKAVVNFINSKDIDKVLLIGESLGGLVSLEAYPFLKDIETMILWAPVTDNKDFDEYLKERVWSKEELNEKGFVTRVKDGKEFRISKKYFEERAGIDQKELLSKIKCPILIVHGNADTTIPLENSKKAMKYLLDGSEIRVIEGASHNFKGFEKEN